MNDPTKDIIPRSAVEYCLRKETVSTNPEKYKTHETFIDYMNDPDISEFGHWMHSNGFNCALTAISVDLKKNPSVTPSAQQWIPCEKELPKSEEEVIVSIHDDSGDTAYDYTSSGWYAAAGKFWVVENETNMRVVAWMPLPEPYKGGIE